MGGAAGKFEAYIISCYLITMTLTTVGYGDIGADNTSERVGYIILFIVGLQLARTPKLSFFLFFLSFA